jgi:hypothetical protein
MERYRPDVLESFQELVGSGGAELLAETYYHSLAFVHSNKEFDRQVEMHLRKIEDIFSVRPRIYRNTELIYNDSIGPLLLDGHQGRPAWQIPFRYEGGPRDCESVAFAQDGKTIYTISEGRASPIIRYREKELIPPSP